MAHGIHMDAFWKPYNRLVAERASASEAIKLLKYKWFGMWTEGGAKEEKERRETVERGGGLGEENQLGLYLKSGYSCKHSGCMEAWAGPGLNMEEFHASAAEKSTGKQGANNEDWEHMIFCFCWVFPQQVCFNVCSLCYIVWICAYIWAYSICACLSMPAFIFFFFLWHHMVKDKALIVTMTTETRWLAVIHQHSTGTTLPTWEAQ